MLKVQTSQDAATIHELRMALEQEKEGKSRELTLLHNTYHITCLVQLKKIWLLS